jgi:ATP-binding cassette subfamily C (CFTR/MRP) protein 1
LDQTSEDSSPTLPKSNVITAIKRVNLTIEKGKFIMVLGDIGSGKSSFLLAILNEMNNSKNSSITVNGSIAYAAQKPWIMHGTVRDNITFCKAFERRKFDTTLSFASLKTDLKMLVRG